MWNRAEPGSRFPAAAPNHPEALLEEPQAFQAIGGKNNKKTTTKKKHKPKKQEKSTTHGAAPSTLLLEANLFPNPLEPPGCGLGISPPLGRASAEEFSCFIGRWFFGSKTKGWGGCFCFTALGLFRKLDSRGKLGIWGKSQMIQDF